MPKRRFVTDKQAQRGLKIAHLSVSALPANVGGLEIVVDNLIRHQRALGHDAQLITRWRQAKAGNALGMDYPILALPPNPKLSNEPFLEIGPRLPVEIALVWHQLRNHFDLIHAHFLYPTAWLANRICARLNVPMIATAHGADVNADVATNYGYRQHQKHERRLQEMAPQLPAVTAISGSIHTALREVGIEPSKIRRIDNGVDLPRFSVGQARCTKARLDLNVPEAAPLILSVGRNQPSKGFAIIPEVLEKLCKEKPNLIWAIVGDGVQALQPDFDALGLGENVRLCDKSHFASAKQFPSDELIALYCTADVFAFPSISEGAPLVALEAMAAKTPIVGNNVRGIKDTIEHEVSGLLCEAGDTNSMADMVTRMLDNDALSDVCIAGGLAKAGQHDWRKIAGEYAALYREVIGSRKS